MLVNGSDCTIVIKTEHKEINVPYSDETIREAVSILQEEAVIEGDGVCRGIRKNNGVTGCIITPLTIGTAPLLLYLAMGACGKPVYISETRNLYKYDLKILPMEDTENFDLIQDRKNERIIYESCHVQGFEIRVMREEAVKLKLDIYGETAPRVYPYTELIIKENEERFKGNCVTYKINGQEYTNIYGITLVSKKQGGTKTEIWIKRALQFGADIPSVIEDMTITAQLQRTQYEYRHYGTFRITVKRLVLVSDETEVNATGAVISPLRFYVSGGVNTEVFTSTGEIIA
jgi:hypothetical protein